MSLVRTRFLRGFVFDDLVQVTHHPSSTPGAGVSPRRGEECGTLWVWNDSPGHHHRDCRCRFGVLPTRRAPSGTESASVSLKAPSGPWAQTPLPRQ